MDLLPSHLLGTAETYDVIVEPKQAHYQIEAESIDRTGFSVGTLHEESSPAVKQIEMPKSRPRALLTMEDMGMSHDMSSMKGMDHDMSSMKGMNHDMSSMKGMDHDMSSMKDMNHDMSSMKGMNHDMSSMKGMNHDMPMNSATVKAASDKNDNTVCLFGILLGS